MEWIEFDTDVRDDKHWLNGRIPRIVFIFIQTVGGSGSEILEPDNVALKKYLKPLQTFQNRLSLRKV